MSKIQVDGYGVTLDFLYSGVIISMWYVDKNLPAGRFPTNVVKYSIMCNRKTIKVSRYTKDDGWEVIIPDDFTLNPVSITPEETMLIAIIPGLNDFERAMHTLASEVAVRWDFDGDEEYTEKYIRDMMGEYLEKV